MRKKLSELMGDIEKYSDSLELAESVDAISYDLDPHEAYILKEAAINLSQLWKLISDIKYAQLNEHTGPSGKPIYYYDSSKQLEAMRERGMTPRDASETFQIIKAMAEEPHELHLEDVYEIDDLNITTRARNLLVKAKICTKEKLCQMTHAELKDMKGMGRKSLEDLIRAVEARGLSFGDS